MQRKNGKVFLLGVLGEAFESFVFISNSTLIGQKNKRTEEEQ